MPDEASPISPPNLFFLLIATTAFQPPPFGVPSLGGSALSEFRKYWQIYPKQRAGFGPILLGGQLFLCFLRDRDPGGADVPYFDGGCAVDIHVSLAEFHAALNMVGVLG